VFFIIIIIDGVILFIGGNSSVIKNDKSYRMCYYILVFVWDWGYSVNSLWQRVFHIFYFRA